MDSDGSHTHYSHALYAAMANLSLFQYTILRAALVTGILDILIAPADYLRGLLLSTLPTYHLTSKQ
jgi:uncharacterized membrane protein YedE/YeeE